MAISQAPVKTITVKEFKMWLQGVEEMQEADWTPNATQWKRIRDKIDQISTAEAAPQPAYTGYRAVERAAAPAGGGPVTLTADGDVIPVPGPSMLPAGGQPAGAPRPAVPGRAPAPMAGSSMPGNKVKTPDIDTTNGTYNPAFV